GLIDFLHHSSDKAGEFGNRAGEDRLAEIDVAENPLERISMAVVRRGREEGAGHVRPILGRGNAERFLGFEVMKEGPLGNTSFGAQLVDGRGRIALGADHRQGRVEKLLPGGGHGTLGQRFIAYGRIILTSRYNSKLRFACRRWAETHDSRIPPKPLPSLANPPRSAPACRRTFDSRARSVRSLEDSLIEDGAISWRCYESRSGSAVTPAMGLGDRLAHPASRLHRRPRLLYRRPRSLLFFHQAGNLVPDLRLLDPDLRRHLRHGRRFRHHHAVPIRHQLEPLHRRDGRRALADDGLRGAHGLFPRSLIPGRSLVRAKAGAGLGAFRRGVHGRL